MEVLIIFLVYSKINNWSLVTWLQYSAQILTFQFKIVAFVQIYILSGSPAIATVTADSGTAPDYQVYRHRMHTPKSSDAECTDRLNRK